MTSAARPLGYGIDFGTSNSAVSVAYADRVEVLPLGRSRSARTLPLFVYLHRGGGREAGDEAVRTFLKSGHAKTDCWKCPLAPYGGELSALDRPELRSGDQDRWSLLLRPVED